MRSAECADATCELAAMAARYWETAPSLSPPAGVYRREWRLRATTARQLSGSAGPPLPPIVLCEQTACFKVHALEVGHRAAAQRAHLDIGHAVLPHAGHAASAEAVTARQCLRLLRCLEADRTLIAAGASAPAARCGGSHRRGARRSSSCNPRCPLWLVLLHHALVPVAVFPVVRLAGGAAVARVVAAAAALELLAPALRRRSGRSTSLMASWTQLANNLL